MLARRCSLFCKTLARRCFTASLAVVIVLQADTCTALEQLKVFRGVLLLEGVIRPGDYSLVFNFLRNEDNFKKISRGVFLASPGGYVFEAMKIGNLIRELRLDTDAPSPPTEKRIFTYTNIQPTDLVRPDNYECISACFLIYVAGVDRHLDGTGRLGLHQPQASSNFLRPGKDNSEGQKNAVRNWIKSYLETMNVPTKYADLMYSVPTNELLWITQEQFNTDLKGFGPVRDSIRQKCHLQTEEMTINLGSTASTVAKGSQNTSPTIRQSDETSKCVARAKAEMSAEGWHKVFQHP